jgi:hypothetical protein
MVNKQKKVRTLIMTLIVGVLLIGAIPFMFNGIVDESEAFSGGAGSISSPYTVSNVNDLNEIRAKYTGAAGVGKYFVLGADITLNGFDAISSFYGNLDGRGHTITFRDGGVGLFRAVSGGSLVNLKLDLDSC